MTDMSVVQRLGNIGNIVLLIMNTVRASVAHLVELNSILPLACIPSIGQDKQEDVFEDSSHADGLRKKL